MLKILVRKWDENKDMLRQAISKRTDLRSIDYTDLVKLTFEIIFNTGVEYSHQRLDLKSITEIDDGDYQGTLLFLIPFDSYQPSEDEYLMTYVGYGSCSGCDTLQAIQDYVSYGEQPSEREVKDFMTLCKDIITNTIKPYNHGWRGNEDFEQVEEK